MENNTENNAMNEYEFNWPAIAQRLIRARVSAGYSSQTALAKEITAKVPNLDPKLTVNDISKVERAIDKDRGESLITLQKMALIARFCNVSLDWLLWGKEEYKNQPTLRDCCRAMAVICDGLEATIHHQYGGDMQEFSAKFPITSDIFCNECITLTIPLYKRVPNDYASPFESYLANFTNDLETALKLGNANSRCIVIDNALKDVPDVPSSNIEEDIHF